MMKRALVGVGKALRDTGQSIERMGMRAQDNFIFAEKFCRHRAIMALYDQRPSVNTEGGQNFVAPNASIVGNVEIEPYSSIWYGAVLRGDQSNLYVGGHTSIGDRSVVLTSAVNPTGFSARTYIGDWVTIGQGCVLRGCTVDSGSVIGDGCIIQEGALVEEKAMLEPGSVLPQGARVPSGEVYGGNPAVYVRKLSKSEIMENETSAEAVTRVAALHAEEFLKYDTNYQLREQMSKDS
jgi:carbonic anhydrase/acetyltransferase-like protein (isoleucine patch superfamily)